MKLLEIRPVGEIELLLAWEDGHRALYRCEYLRLNCPCAACCDEWSGKRLVTLEKIPRDIKIQDFAPIGLYAVRFRFSDGHQTGIFGFEFLRKICPCASCVPGLDKEKKECCGGH